ncbi:hypothetical protein [Streptosporangium sp. KLBMP 9127]|nr:hypothetical protein [Streptosporangium sp. KLBMP 9127]
MSTMRVEPSTTTAPPSWEVWMRGRGAEVIVMMRIGHQVSELSLTGDRDVLAALGEILGAIR